MGIILADGNGKDRVHNFCEISIDWENGKPCIEIIRIFDDVKKHHKREDIENFIIEIQKLQLDNKEEYVECFNFLCKHIQKWCDGFDGFFTYVP